MRSKLLVLTNVLGMSIWSCNADDFFVLTDLPEGSSIALSYFASLACILDANDQPVCWGYEKALGTALGTSNDLHVWGQRTVCDFQRDRLLRCAGDTPLVLEGVRKVQDDLVLLDDGTIRTFGFLERHAQKFSGNDFVDLSPGCALSTSRGLVCSFLIEDDNSFVGSERIFGNSDWICGFSRSEPDPECVETLGAPTHTTTANVPTNLDPEFEFFVSGMGVACHLDPSTGLANCWSYLDESLGLGSTVRSSVEGLDGVDVIEDLNRRTWLDLAASRTNLCGVTTEGEVRCYGDFFFWRDQIPDG